jgi:diacylglycerol kinase family enzyme
MVIEHDKNGDVQNIRPREIRFCSDDTECVDIMRGALGYNEKPIFFILNPFGGTKSSKKVYHRVVLPMLRIAGLEERHELVETEYSHHATEIAKQLDVTKYQSVVTISGDGVFHEVLNGLLGRKDWERAIKVPIGTIGSGSANAIGKNTDTRDTRLAVLNILKCMSY